MSHLDEIRLMEQALSSNNILSEEEAAHLRACSLCSARVAQEQFMTRALEQLPRRPAPEGFVQAVAMRLAVHVVPVNVAFPLLWSAVASIVLIAATVWFAGTNIPAMASAVTAVLAGTAACAKVFGTILNHLPLLGNIMIVFVCTLALVSGGMLALLMKKSHSMKYDARPIRIAK